MLSCTKENTYTKGEINPERFVMIGGSHSSGYMDDALYREGQLHSPAFFLAEQLKLVGLSSFSQPLTSENSVGIGLSGLSAMYLGYKTDCQGETSLSPLRTATTGDQNILAENLASSAPFGNYGIPGLKLSEVKTANYGNNNPFFARMASSAGSSVFDDVSLANPSFFALFLGVEDVLEYAKSGGTIASLPSSADFEAQYRALLQDLTSGGAKGVIATIPDVSQMPYFTTIPWNGLSLDTANNNTLNAVYNPLGFNFQVGANPFMIADTSANMFAVRQIYSDELLLLSLPLDSVKCYQMGVLFPIRDEFVLDRGELTELRSKISEYNIIIRNLASQYNLAVAETGSFVENLIDGFTYNGIAISAKFVSGGAYSLDGIHFNPRGNALLTNKFIQAINDKYNSTIPELSAGAYRSILFPN